jgi:thiamine biosynthesis lipoprotein
VAKFLATAPFTKASLVILGSLLFLCACSAKPSNEKLSYEKISGSTMGTDYHITFAMPANTSVEAIQQAITERLLLINQSMSTYIPESEIGRFNRSAVGETLTVSQDFVSVLTLAQQVYKDSDGAFDPSIAPLVNLWGFGPQLSVENFKQQPAADKIAQMLAQINFLSLQQSGKQGELLSKTQAISLDFSAIAKGYAVDELALLLDAAGSSNYMVEIGGELKTRGVNPSAKAWRIAIQRPDNIRGESYSVLVLREASVATSGDYRNYFEIEGKRYSHTINPQTGYPVEHKLSSVTVIADNVALADAYATALMVLGEDAGFALAQGLQLAVYMIYHDGEGFAAKFTAPMQAYLQP